MAGNRVSRLSNGQSTVTSASSGCDWPLVDFESLFRKLPDRGPAATKVWRSSRR